MCLMTHALSYRLQLPPLDVENVIIDSWAKQAHMQTVIMTSEVFSKTHDHTSSATSKQISQNSFSKQNCIKILNLTWCSEKDSAASE